MALARFAVNVKEAFADGQNVIQDFDLPPVWKFWIKRRRRSVRRIGKDFWDMFKKWYHFKREREVMERRGHGNRKANGVLVFSDFFALEKQRKNKKFNKRKKFTLI